MVFYEVKLDFEICETERTDTELAVKKSNKHFFHIGSNSTPSLLIYSIEEKRAKGIIAFDCSLMSADEAVRKIERSAHSLRRFKWKRFAIDPVSLKEVTINDAVNKLEYGEAKGLLDEVYCDLFDLCDAHYMRCDNIELREFLLPKKALDRSKAENEAKKLLADESLFKELERVYSPLNKKEFRGIPVHYVINAASKETAKHLVELLAHALFSNQRIKSSRVTHVDDPFMGGIDHFSSLCENSFASLVAVECTGNKEEGRFARDAERKVSIIEENIKRFNSNILFVLVTVSGESKICKHCVNELSKKDIAFIEINEGKGDLRTAKSYLLSLLKENDVFFSKNDLSFPKQKDYSAFDVAKAYDSIKAGSLVNEVYKAYKDVKTLEVEKPKSLSCNYDKLQNLVGLEKIKEIVDQIIAANKVNKLRKEMGLDATCTAKHMIFTGNPGSAKTTVARLLAAVLFDEHILEKYRFIECGRQDLVGQYVGWTAKQIEAKFREASGGVLFIDEAYSLVERDGLYGDEAINTIVQLMENNKDNVIVIFAGYPDKMKSFLDKNEGLRSRIAFHVDFPDYNADELVSILRLMLKDRGYTIEADAEEKCRSIFETACENPEFGNGRFVRNILEQAIIRQSSRIMDEFQGQKIKKESIIVLKAEDFEVNAAESYKPEPKRRMIGFSA